MIVFAGPTLVGADPGHDGIEIRPPAKQGDIYLATLDRPAAIGLIDGYFEGVPAVWHKEILWALAEGIPVLGASSMGALRAAELDAFGMIGVGKIYQSFQNGTFEDDDEVAVLHAPAEVGYASLSVAMVNIRATVSAAVEERILSAGQASNVIETAKALHYGDRTWPATSKQLPEAARQDFVEWLADHFVDQKQRDALEMLDCMARGDFPAPPVEPFHFECTDLWIASASRWVRDARPRERAGSGGFQLLPDDRFAE